MKEFNSELEIACQHVKGADRSSLFSVSRVQSLTEGYGTTSVDPTKGH